MPARPAQGGSSGTWGSELNAWLDASLNADGSLKTAAVQTALGGSIPAVGAATTMLSVGQIEHEYAVYFPWMDSASTTIGLTSVTGGLGTRWCPIRNTTFYGIIVNITASAGNICISLYDESFTRLSTSGSVASPGTGIQMLHLPSGGVDVLGGKTYWIDVSSDNTATLRFAGWTQTNNVTGGRSIAYQRGASGTFPAPAQLLTLAHNVQIGTPGSGMVLSPVTDPPRVAKPAAGPTTILTSGGEVFAQDPATGRLFAGTAGNALAYSDDLGTTWTTTTFTDGNPIRGIVIIGSVMLISTGSSATPAVGAIYKGATAGPYTVAGFPSTLTGQEGYARQWCFVGYSDGVVFAGNYDPNGNGSSQVRIRKSIDFGATWSIVVDLGPADGSLRHVHSIIRDANDTTKVWANIGDSGVLCGVYKSINSGASFSIVSTFGAMRLTPVVQTTDGGFLWLSDQYRLGGDLFYMDSAGTVLKPRSHYDSPWNGDGYAMSAKDAQGRIYYVTRYSNTTYTRSALHVTGDEGVTSHLFADRGGVTGYGVQILRAGNYLFFENLRWDVSALTVAG